MRAKESEARKTIEDCDQFTRDANMRAIQSQGWRKSVHLWFAGLFSWLGDWGREIERDELRGKDDDYHDEY